MKLTDMKITAAEQEERDKLHSPEVAGPSPGYSDRYPYGLEIRLDTQSLEKLGMTKLPAVGKKMRVTAEVKVESVSQNDRTNKDGKSVPDRNVTLQICKLGLEKAGPQNELEAIDAGIDEAY